MSKTKETNSVSGALPQIEKAAAMTAWIEEGELCPDVLKLEQGQAIRVIVEGPGQVIAMTDAAGDPRDLPTYRVRFANGARADLMGDYQLTANLPGLFGHEIGIHFKGTEKTRKGMNCNDYDIVDFGLKVDN